MSRRYTRAQLEREARTRAGCKVLRVARSTGTLVGLYDAEPAELDASDGRWATVCETHGSILNHPNRATAESWLSHPEEWCSECQDRDAPPREGYSAGEFGEVFGSTPRARATRRTNTEQVES